MFNTQNDKIVKILISSSSIMICTRVVFVIVYYAEIVFGMCMIIAKGGNPVPVT